MVSVTHDGMTVDTNTGDEASVRASMGVPAEGQEADAANSGSETAGADGADGASDAEPVADAAAPPVESKPRKHKPRDDSAARMYAALAQAKAEKERAAALEAELQSLRTKAVASGAQETVAARTEPPTARAKPKEEEVGSKYQTYADFIEDLADWKAEQRLAGIKPAQNLDALIAAELEKREQQRRQTDALSAHMDRVNAIREQHPDYDDKVNAADEALAAAGLTLSAAAAQAVLSSEHSGTLVYWLATHPTDYLQLARDTQRLDVSAASLVRQLLEARLGAVETPGSARPALTSRAKPPIKPVGASPLAPLSEDASDDEPFEKFFARENSRDRKAGRL